MSKTIQEIAEQLVGKNPKLAEVAEANPGNNYKAVEALVSAKLVTAIGRKEGLYLKRNELIWAIIDCATGGSEEELDY